MVSLTATIMAGFVASLSGTYIYIWMLVGFVPKLATACSEAQKPSATHVASTKMDGLGRSIIVGLEKLR